MKLKTTAILFTLCILSFSSNMQAKKIPPYKDASLPTEQRVEDLIKRMTLEEKIAQISHIHSWHIFDGQKLDKTKLAEKCGTLPYGFFEGFPLTSSAVRENFHEIQKYLVENTRLGIPAFPCAESLHGVVHEGCTVYPQNIALGSTFNTNLAYQAAKYTSGELNTLGIKQVFAPCIDVARELRWGRVEESFGEDPYLCSMIALAQTNGYLEGGTSPMLKHFGPHGMPNSGLNLASVECGTRDLHEIFMKPFEVVVKNTPVMAVMSSYNSWNRVPNSSSRYLLTDLLRDRYGFKGYVYSDWGVLDMLKNFHRTAETDFDAARQALTAGLDVEASSFTFTTLADNIRAGKLDEKYVDEAVRRVLRAKIETGLMDDPYLENCAFYLPIRDPKAVALSKEIADESAVLVKNENNLLPLDKSKLKTVAVIGPNADAVQFGDYTWTKDVKEGVTPLAGIKKLLGKDVKINYAKGCSVASLDTTGIADAVRAARESDVAIVVVGSSSTVFVRGQSESTSGEGMDLTEIELTGAQEKLVRDVAATGTPVVLVLVAGKPFAIPWAAENIPAILVQWYAGEREGDSLADILFGNVNPSGRLNFSFPRSTGQLPVYYNHLPSDKGYYHVHGSYENPGRDYVFSTPEALWSFGHGMSYTTFDYTNANTDKREYSDGDTIGVSVDITNKGSREGKEVVQVYVRDVVSSIATPVRALKGFDKISLTPGETKHVSIKIPVEELYLTDDGGNRYLEPGKFEIQIGRSSSDICHTIPVWVGENAPVENTGIPKDIKTQKNPSNNAKVIKLRGNVRDIQATPIAGVTVKCEASGATSTTDKMGNYVMEVPSDAQLTFSKKGFGTQHKQLKGERTLSVVLSQE